MDKNKYDVIGLKTQSGIAQSGKEQYLKSKQAASEERKRKTREERLRRECEELEAELSRVETELFGDAASDYVRAAELDQKRTELEARLMEIYEEL